jgi:hypothetical protein
MLVNCRVGSTALSVALCNIVEALECRLKKLKELETDLYQNLPNVYVSNTEYHFRLVHSDLANKCQYVA